MEKLKKQLLKDGQVLDFESPPVVSAIQITKEQIGGIVLDDGDAERTGFASFGSSISPFLGAGYLHDGDTEKGSQTARFIPELPKAGTYRVSMLYSAANNRATNVPVLIHTEEGDKTIVVDQKKKPANGPLLLLGTFRFAAGKNGFVEISNKGTDGHVIVDGIQWLEILP